ncbi:MAG: ECF transporter S component, partial [Anaerolineae bacterium]
GYAQWAIFSLLVHGIQGYVAGLLTRRIPGLYGRLIAVSSGGLILIVGYFFAGILLTGIGEAVTGILPNVLQALSGGIVGIPLFAAVLRAYPPLAQWGAFGHWTE